MCRTPSSRSCPRRRCRCRSWARRCRRSAASTSSPRPTTATAGSTTSPAPCAAGSTPSSCRCRARPRRRSASSPGGWTRSGAPSTCRCCRTASTRSAGSSPSSASCAAASPPTAARSSSPPAARCRRRRPSPSSPAGWPWQPTSATGCCGPGTWRRACSARSCAIPRPTGSSGRNISRPWSASATAGRTSTAPAGRPARERQASDAAAPSGAHAGFARAGASARPAGTGQEGDGMADGMTSSGTSSGKAGVTVDVTEEDVPGPGWPAVGPLLLGVRHHGPGSARAVRAALEAARPAVVLIEGPPEADPPVALLAHAVDEPGRSAFWPLAEFSPEWVALRWAVDHGIPARFIDLPAAHTLAWQDDTEGADDTEDTGDADRDGREDPDDSEEADGPGDAIRIDPLGVLARTAGHDDAERWWEDVVEHRGGDKGDPLAPFTALEEAMTALRDTYGSGGHHRDLLREAHMRLAIRAARREAGERVAVVCGAWHVPALRRRTTVAADRALLKG